MSPLPNENDDLVATGPPCLLCGVPFVFNVDTVPVVMVDPVYKLPPDHPGVPVEEVEAAKARAVKHPVCPGCVQKVIEYQRSQGMPVLWSSAS